MKRIRIGRYIISAKYLYITGGVLALLAIGWVVFLLSKSWVLDKAISKIQSKLKEDYGLTLGFTDYTLEGWSVVEMEGISVLTPSSDTMAYFGHVVVDVKLMPLISGKIRLDEILSENGLIDATYIRDIQSDDVEENIAGEVGDTTMYGRVKKYLSYLEMASGMIPDLFMATNTRLRYRDSVDNINALLDSLRYGNNEFKMVARLEMQGKRQQWRASGTFDRANIETHAKIATDDTTFFSFNFIRQIAKADIGFNEFTFDLDDYSNKKDKVELKGGVLAKRAFIYSPRLASDTVVVKHGGLDFNVRINESEIELEKGSKLILNEIEAPFQATYQYSPEGALSAKLNMPSISANEFLTSLPEGLFEHVRGMRMKGELSYKLDFYVDLDKKDTIRINSDMDGKGLQIVRYGKAKLDKLNSSFVYVPYNSDRQIIVGPENPDFTPIGQVSPYVKEAILVSEDPSFFRHRGFVEQAIEQSFLENLRAERFKRGGSTISMQLVKNVFLSHEKTLERKLEEIFIVWLIENLRIASKERMYEVYLNVIEWGPGVYGIKEASQFYFSKHPSQLSMGESVFLANIVPRPRAFAWRFDEYGNLREYARQQSVFISNIMYRRGLISEAEHLAYYPHITIRGPARQHMRIKPLPQDSLDMYIEEEERLLKGVFDWLTTPSEWFKKKDRVEATDNPEIKPEKEKRKKRRRAREEREEEVE